MQNFPNNIVPTLSLYFIYYTTLIESCQFARAIIDKKVAANFCVSNQRKVQQMPVAERDIE